MARQPASVTTFSRKDSQAPRGQASALTRFRGSIEQSPLTQAVITLTTYSFLHVVRFIVTTGRQRCAQHNVLFAVYCQTTAVRMMRRMECLEVFIRDIAVNKSQVQAYTAIADGGIGTKASY